MGQCISGNDTFAPFFVEINQKSEEKNIVYRM